MHKACSSETQRAEAVAKVRTSLASAVSALPSVRAQRALQ